MSSKPSVLNRHAARAPQTWRRSALIVLLLLLVGLPASRAETAQTAEQVLDIKRSGPSPAGSNPRSFVHSGDLAFFVATRALYGQELWKTDGTPEGTTLVRDIVPGFQSSAPLELTDVGGTLFFTILDASTNRRALWKSDGTAEGTVPLGQPTGDRRFDAGLLTDVGGRLFFRNLAESLDDFELWTSDGTPAGTLLVKDINPGPSGSRPAHLTDVGGTLFFTADDGIHGHELWTSDGTAAGTRLVKDIMPADRDRYTAFGGMAAIDQTLLFTVRDSGNGDAGLWKSDGTTAGTMKLAQVVAEDMTTVGNLVFFRGHDRQGTGLWMSDGTAAGTTMLKHFSTGRSLVPNELTAVGQTLYFKGPGDGAYSLWKSNGTAAGTVLVRDLPAGGEPAELTAVGDELRFKLAYFSNESGGDQLWRSNGTAAGTTLVKTFAAQSLGGLTSYDGALLFAADDGTTGSEPWRSDGTVAGTSLLKEIIVDSDGIPIDTRSTPPLVLFAAGTRLFFGGNDGTTGNELWISDGTAAGTRLVKDIQPGAGSSFPNQFAALGSIVVFRADDGVHGMMELWRTDGTAEGTYLLKDINSGGSSNPGDFTELNGYLYFSATDGSGAELWRTDGTPDGTTLVKEFSPRTTGAAPRILGQANGRLFLVADDGVNGRELWITDGTADGTTLVKNITFGGDDSNIIGSAVLNNTLLFVLRGYQEFELWRSDGTEPGTTLVKEFPIAPGSNYTYASPAELTVVGDKLYFRAMDTMGDAELWRSDGTADGTTMVKNINPQGSSGPRSLAHIGGMLLFAADDGTTGVELWRSDGTEAGTVLVQDIYPGPLGSQPHTISEVDNAGIAVFAASNGLAGAEVWQSDGTPQGTSMAADIARGAASSNPVSFTTLNDRIFFVADDSRTGSELWRLVESTPLLTPRVYIPLVVR